MSTIDFNRIASDAIASHGGQIESRCCPDQYVGRLSQIVGRQDFPERLPAVMRPNSPCIILVLESPHIDEYIGTPGPAKGFTGEMIRLHLQKALPIEEIGGYGLIVMNAIQYQCSLGVSTDFFRDRVFRASWNFGGRESLGTRVERLYRHGDILVNCCTKGKDYDVNTPLRLLVEEELRRVLPGVRSIRRLHPSSWRKPTLASVEWSIVGLESHDEEQQAQKINSQSMAPTSIAKSGLHFGKSEIDAVAVGDKSNPDAPQALEKNRLVEVQEDVLVSGASCTVLVFSNGSRQHMKTATFDPQGLITAKAKRMLGMVVKTTCWNPRSAPGRWSSLGYFNDVFPA
jgi:hypothetical protein